MHLQIPKCNHTPSTTPTQTAATKAVTLPTTRATTDGTAASVESGTRAVDVHRGVVCVFVLMASVGGASLGL